MKSHHRRQQEAFVMAPRQLVYQIPFRPHRPLNLTQNQRYFYQSWE